LSFLFGGAIAGFLGVGFGHVFAMFGFAVPVRAGLVVNAGVGVDPNHAAAICGRSCCWAVAAGAYFAPGVAGAAALDEAAEAGVEAEGATGVMGATGETGLSVAAEVFFFDLDLDLVALASV
jgi:hypothetical protein